MTTAFLYCCCCCLTATGKCCKNWCKFSFPSCFCCYCCCYQQSRCCIFCRFLLSLSLFCSLAAFLDNRCELAIERGRSRLELQNLFHTRQKRKVKAKKKRVVCAKNGHGNRSFDHKRDEIYKKFSRKKVNKTFSRGETTILQRFLAQLLDKFCRPRAGRRG